MDQTTSDFKSHSLASISHLKEDLKSIRTGRANPAILENLIVETYGGQTKLKLMELSTIVTEGPSLLAVTPFDPATVTDIERAILKSPLGFSPRMQGNKIYISIPPLSEEQRHKFIKLINTKIEEKKVSVRSYRDEARRKIKSQFEKKEITEDDKFTLEKEIDAESQKLMEEIQKIKDSKEKEIMEV